MTERTKARRSRCQRCQRWVPESQTAKLAKPGYAWAERVCAACADANT